MKDGRKEGRKDGRKEGRKIRKYDGKPGNGNEMKIKVDGKKVDKEKIII